MTLLGPLQILSLNSSKGCCEDKQKRWDHLGSPLGERHWKILISTKETRILRYCIDKKNDIAIPAILQKVIVIGQCFSVFYFTILLLLFMYQLHSYFTSLDLTRLFIQDYSVFKWKRPNGYSIFYCLKKWCTDSNHGYFHMQQASRIHGQRTFWFIVLVYYQYTNSTLRCSIIYVTAKSPDLRLISPSIFSLAVMTSSSIREHIT